MRRVWHKTSKQTLRKVSTLIHAQHCRRKEFINSGLQCVLRSWAQLGTKSLLPRVEMSETKCPRFKPMWPAPWNVLKPTALLPFWSFYIVLLPKYQTFINCCWRQQLRKKFNCQDLITSSNSLNLSALLQFGWRRIRCPLFLSVSSLFLCKFKKNLFQRLSVVNTSINY